MTQGGAPTFDPAIHYDRVTRAWRFLLGEELHYGVFKTGDEDLPTATQALTERMAERAQLAEGMSVLDVGCGTGAPACAIAKRYRCRVHGISTSEVGLAEARARAERMGLADLVSFELRDGMNNGYPDLSFDRVWVLESSHLMPSKDRLLAECARVLRPRGRMVLCDIILRAPMPLPEVIKWRDELLLLRDVFGQAKMELMDLYCDLTTRAGLQVEARDDLSEATFATFARWRENAARNKDAVADLIGEHGWQQFVDSCGVLERLWQATRLGYGFLAAARPA